LVLNVAWKVSKEPKVAMMADSSAPSEDGKSSMKASLNKHSQGFQWTALSKEIRLSTVMSYDDFTSSWKSSTTIARSCHVVPEELVVQVATTVEANGLVQAHLASNVLGLDSSSQLVSRFVEVVNIRL
jgi:hypothetical protein